MESDNKTAVSMQGLGLDFALEELGLPENAVLYCDEEQSCYIARFNGNESIVALQTCMYPADYDIIGDARELLAAIRKRLPRMDLRRYDVYWQGVGLSQKDVPEDERGVFCIGKRYKIYMGELTLLSKREDDNYGYDVRNPVRMSMVSDEYMFLNNVRYVDGWIAKHERLCSMVGEHGIIDKWEVRIAGSYRFPRRLYLYFDPYAINPELETYRMETLPQGFIPLLNETP